MTTTETPADEASGSERGELLSRVERGCFVSLATGQRGVYRTDRWREVTRPFTLAVFGVMPFENQRGRWLDVDGFEVNAKGDAVQARQVYLNAAGIGLIRPALKENDRVRDRVTGQSGTVVRPLVNHERLASLVQFRPAGRVIRWDWGLELDTDPAEVPQQLPQVTPGDYVWVDGLNGGARQESENWRQLVRPFWLEVSSTGSARQFEGQQWLTLAGWEVGSHGKREMWRYVDVTAAGIGPSRRALREGDKVLMGTGEPGTVSVAHCDDELDSADRRMCTVALGRKRVRRLSEWDVDPM